MREDVNMSYLYEEEIFKQQYLAHFGISHDKRRTGGHVAWNPRAATRKEL